MKRAATDIDGARAPRAGYLLFTLTAACLLSFIDRFTLNVLLGSIKGSLQLSDAQAGLLLGFAFSILYSVMAMPFGWVVDRWNRRNLILLGVIVWSLATAASGLATTFEHLFIARIFVGIGEATLMPAAYSMLADAYAPRERGRAYGVFSMAVFAGGGIALLLGGGLLALASSLVRSAPQLGIREPWHLVFLMIGALGAPMALLILATPEPTRRAKASREAHSDVSLIRYVWRHGRAFAWLLTLYTIYTYVVYGILPWAPTVIARRFALDPATAGLMIGVVTLIGGAGGALAGGAMSDRWIARRTPGGRLRATVVWWIGALFTIPWFAFAPTALVSALGYMGFSFVNGFVYVSMSAVFQDVVPSELRGRITSFFYFVTYLGAGTGPLATGLLTDKWFGSPAALPQAILVMSVPGVIIGLVCSIGSFRHYDALRLKVAAAG